jgi:hypothetical protein
LLTKIAVTLGIGLGFGVPAADAMGASLSVRVSPAKLHPGTRYSVTITGSYDRRPKAPYLLAFIQYTGAACRATANGEYDLPTSEWAWAIYPQIAEPRSPFKAVSYWKAGSHLGNRRVCAYLYAKPVTPSTTASPLLRASVAFSNTRATG